MTRRALRIASENGKVFYRTFPIGKKRKKSRQEKLEEQMRKFNPKLYYGVQNA
jgi:hypothetical protein|tara:strand:- start:1033 stop:1191 length:159 start_codon:yes stop_codon:yes gene_type:complete